MGSELEAYLFTGIDASTGEVLGGEELDEDLTKTLDHLEACHMLEIASQNAVMIVYEAGYDGRVAITRSLTEQPLFDSIGMPSWKAKIEVLRWPRDPHTMIQISREITYLQRTYNHRLKKDRQPYKQAY